MIGGTSCSAQETERLGEGLAGRLASGDAIMLEGDLAAGKTTFVRGLVRGLRGDPDEVTSPSFVLVQSYPCAAGAITILHHVDLYRLAGASSSAVREVGLEELLSEEASVVAVEWPQEVLAGWVPTGARLWRVSLTINADGSRTITITPPE